MTGYICYPNDHDRLVPAVKLTNMKIVVSLGKTTRKLYPDEVLQPGAKLSQVSTSCIKLPDICNLSNSSSILSFLWDFLQVLGCVILGLGLWMAFFNPSFLTLFLEVG